MAAGFVAPPSAILAVGEVSRSRRYRGAHTLAHGPRRPPLVAARMGSKAASADGEKVPWQAHAGRQGASTRIWSTAQQLRQPGAEQWID